MTVKIKIINYTSILNIGNTNLHIVTDLVWEWISRSISRWRAAWRDVITSHGHPWVWMDRLSRHIGQVEVHGSCTTLEKATLIIVLDIIIERTSIYQRKTKE